jgi:alginate O-acetyltransferase complex protein AlgJ
MLSVYCLCGANIARLLSQVASQGMRGLEKRENIVQSTGFILVLVAFFICSIYACVFRHETLSEQENRTLSEFPKIHTWKKDLPKFPSAFESFFKDHVAFRLPLICGRNLLIFEGFKASGNPLVVVGRQNWLFYKSYGVTPAQLNFEPFSEEELHCWAQNIIARNSFLSEHHIKYLLMLAPEKGSMYPELLPWGWHRGSGTSRLEQLQDYLRKNTNIDFVDARQLLRDEKLSGQKTYHSNDTHWNQRSAILICQAILSHLHKECNSVEPVSPEHLLQGHDKFNGDLSKMLVLQSLLPDYSPSIVVNKAPQAVPCDDSIKLASMDSQEKAFACQLDDASLPRVLVLRDSFFTYITAPLSEHFRFCEFQWTNNFHPQEILQEKPDILINEIAERHLYEEFHEHVPDIIHSESSVTPICSYGDKLALVSLAGTKKFNGIMLKLHWRSRQAMGLNYTVGIHCLNSESKVVGGADYQPDILRREVDKDMEWTDTAFIPDRELKKATHLGIFIYYPGKQTVLCDAPQSASGTSLVKRISEFVN